MCIFPRKLKHMKKWWWIPVAAWLVQSCTAAAFDKAQPENAKGLASFPKAMQGDWESTEESTTFYVDKLHIEDTAVTYMMNSISPDSPSTIALKQDSVEIREIKDGYVFCLAGDKLWLNYVLRMPEKDQLVVYGFDDAAKKYVKHYEEDDSGEGILFIKYYATPKEWKKLLASKALKRFRTFKRVQP